MTAPRLREALRGGWAGLALFALFVCVVAAPAFAAERIESFDVTIQVERDGDIVVTERIEVTAEGVEIRRGIFRDLPRYYLRGDGRRYAYDYDVLSVRRDGDAEPYDTENVDNAFRIRIGDEDVFLTPGRHRYELRYRVANQVRYFENYDEIYWNATGNYWAFPIERASATVLLPEGARVRQTAAYTGPPGASGDDYSARTVGDRLVFEATRPLNPGEGLTVAIGFEKGSVDPPSALDASALWWQRYGALGILVASLGALFAFLYRSWRRVGRDPVKGPVFPRYEPPQGYSPAAVHHIYHRGVSGHRALIATLMNLAVKGRIKIDAADKKRTHLTLDESVAPPADIAPEDRALEARIFAAGDTKTLGQRYDAGFTSAYGAFRQALSQRYGDAYFRWNAAYTIGAFVLTVIAVVAAAQATVNWSVWHSIAVMLLALLNIAFMYLMPAPTVRGQAVRTEIEGFRLYMEKAEQLQLNAVEPSGSSPPPMTTERYERFLPYAVALGVEEPWTRHFERLLPEEAARYRPAWSGGLGSRSFSGVTSALVANMSSGVTAALPQTSSSSGSGGGGSSGGGGGGGGGGGW